MKFEQLEIEPTEEGVIRLAQVDGYGDEHLVVITPDMVDIVCGELQRLKKELA
jgi:hypothetical protein